jgi:hypothetical protein
MADRRGVAGLGAGVMGLIGAIPAAVAIAGVRLSFQGSVPFSVLDVLIAAFEIFAIVVAFWFGLAALRAGRVGPAVIGGLALLIASLDLFIVVRLLTTPVRFPDF